MSTSGRGRGQENRGGGQGIFFYANNKGKNNGNNDGGKKFGKSQVQCFYYKRFGYYESNCWKNKRNKHGIIACLKKKIFCIFFGR